MLLRVVSLVGNHTANALVSIDLTTVPELLKVVHGLKKLRGGSGIEKK